MRWFVPLLYPFSLLYDLGTRLRNRMFDVGLKKSIEFSIPTIVVGNLSMGGTGKTPFVELLIRLFSEKYQICTLSRGYGRTTKGFILANKNATASQIGDEPFQIYSKFGDKINVAVGEERILAIPEIIAQKPETEVVILDDAFQHRYVKGDLNIMLTTYQKPFFEDKVVPLGTLREAKVGARRAGVIIVTKCPSDMANDSKRRLSLEIKKNNPQVKVIFAGLKYGNPIDIGYSSKINFQNVILVSGIADNSLFKKEVKKQYQVVKEFTFSDHHHYKINDVKKIVEFMKDWPDSVILTTEKDAVKLKAPIFREYLEEIAIFALPIEVNLSEEDLLWLEKSVSKVIKDKGYIREI
ncbi:lipid-A-disaccharide kinase [Belliella baltica DSM 15883]|uniref:Tetraacyldisaccharide 4'-kinase n=1 Tax=Belliella baltica (strain DSM 15883 / CIP 108006 / LMG 21964 / BA134) TaxID=866536 RepID=I3Z6E8_BELBD|nr:tetraacyldisaccharide 4'-kinase [Belliella baltica]AFL84816.1 lipid-A-disaccharide kinase [Belliella baltica DSM 15883]